jgi:hypothetical protein
MKKVNIVFLMMLCNSIFANDTLKTSLAKPSSESAKYFDINRIRCSIQNNGIFGRHPITGNTDLSFDDYPLVYSSGLWISAKIDGEIRASRADFNTDYTEGAFDSDGNLFGKDDSSFFVFKISKGDNETNNRDYADWPYWNGAPVDQFGKPLLLGNQTLWCVFTDTYMDNRMVTEDGLPLGAEIHLTVWGWENLDNIMLMRWKIINKSNKIWKDTYFGVFSDPDVGDASWNLVGSDSTLNLVYCYEGRQSIYVWRNHAVGYQLLESPVVYSPGDTAIAFGGIKYNFKNIPVYSPIMRKGQGRYEGWGWNDIPYYEEAPQQIYNRLRCLNMMEEPAIDPLTNLPSKWAYSGDPVAGTGWLDEFPVDRRMMLSTGPIDVSPGDTCALTLAVFGVQNNLQMENIVELRHNSKYVKELFLKQFGILVNAKVEERKISDTEWEVIITAFIENKHDYINQVTAEIRNYQHQLIDEVTLFDDGAHFDYDAHDEIFGTCWRTDSHDEALYLNVKIIDEYGKIHNRNFAAESITLSDKLVFEPIVINDSRNYDGVANPGEQIRYSFKITNNYSFNIQNLSLSATVADSIFVIQYPTMSYFMDSLSVGESDQFSSIFTIYNRYQLFPELTLPMDIPENYPITFDLNVFDAGHHHWKDTVYLPIKAYKFIPNEMNPTQVSGKSDATFTIRIVEPTLLTGHSYAITINDSLDEIGLNLIDLTLDNYLLMNNPLPDKYAYNVPVTDGFKVVQAHIPEEGILDAYYEDIIGGHVAGFEGVNFGGEFFDGGVRQGTASSGNIYSIEIEFTNDIKPYGVVKDPRGQIAYRYLYNSPPEPTAIQSNPFAVWKTLRGEKISLLNVCFFEVPGSETCNGIWAPDNSQHGGNEMLFIMTTDYDPTGTYYFNKQMDPNEVMYKLSFRLKSDSSVVDTGDKFIIQWGHATTSEDRWEFIPTNIKVESESLPVSFELCQNYPNPFNSNTTIKFTVDKPSKTNLKVYNYLGQEVIELFDKEFQSGEFSVSWNGKSQNGQLVSSGLYFTKLKSEQKSCVVKMLLIR